MNILHISPNFNYSCGISRYVYNLLKEFADNKSTRLYFVTNGGDALENLNSINIKPYLIDFADGYKNVINVMKNYNQIRKICHSNKIDIIHTHHRYPELISTMLSRKLEIPTVTTVHSLVSGFKLMSFKSDKIIAVSKAVENNLINEFNADKKKIVLLRYYVNPFSDISEMDKEKFRDKIAIGKNTKIILFAGRVSKIKGCDILLKAFNKIPSELNAVLIVVGKIIDNEIFSLMEGKERIKYFPSSSNIEEFYSICDLVVLPSRKDPFPFVMLESGLCKKPFIGANVDGIAEFIEHEKDGLLFNSENENKLAEAILFYLKNEAVAHEYANNLNIKVHEQLNKTRHIKKLLSIYHEIIK